MSTNDIKSQDSSSSLSALINGRLLLIGCLLGFAYCIVEGHLVSNHNYLRNFKRFSMFTGLESQYYPTIRQFRSLAYAHLNHNHDAAAGHPILVIIGGSSVFNGIGQSIKNLWSDHLQEVLGDKFCVVNLAMRGAAPTAGAECVSEYLIKNKVPVIYVADVGRMSGVPADGGDTYNYQYWQARAGGFLLPNPLRDQSAQLRDPTGQGALRANLAEYLRFDDLWSYFTYNYMANCLVMANA